MIHGRPPKLQPSATLVIWGARNLTLGEKVVWYHDWALDAGGPDACWASHEAMAQRVGGSLTAGTISRLRQQLKRLTLHVPIARPNARNLGWVAVLPLQCIPRSHRDAPAMATVLDAYLSTLAVWRERLNRLDARVQPEQTLEDEGEAAALGGRGGRSFSASKSEAQLPSGFREKGDRAFARKDEKGVDDIQRPMNADERAAFEESLKNMSPRQAAMLRRIALG